MQPCNRHLQCCYSHAAVSLGMTRRAFFGPGKCRTCFHWALASTMLACCARIAISWSAHLRRAFLRSSTSRPCPALPSISHSRCYCGALCRAGVYPAAKRPVCPAACCDANAIISRIDLLCDSCRHESQGRSTLFQRLGLILLSETVGGRASSLASLAGHAAACALSKLSVVKSETAVYIASPNVDF